VSFHKTLAFGVSGFLGGVGGALYTVWSGTVAVRDLDIWQSFVVLCAVVLGGMGSIRGVLLGTVILISPGEVLRFEFHGVRVPPEARYLIYGVLLLILMRFRPQGLIPRARGGYPPTPEEEQVMRSKESPLYVLQCREEGRE
jgi:branched-chain amino acid transport system permease protein